MKSKVKRRNSPCIFNLQFITASTLVLSDFGVYWSVGNLQGSLLLFLSLHVGRYLAMESVQEKWDFGTCWNLCKLKILMMRSPSVKTTSGNFLVFRRLQKNKPKQAENVPCVGFRTNCIIWGRLLVLGKLQNTQQSSLKHTTYVPSVNLIIRFSGNYFSQDCFSHYSLKCHVWEKVQLFRYGLKNH